MKRVVEAVLLLVAGAGAVGSIMTEVDSPLFWLCVGMPWLSAGVVVGMWMRQMRVGP